MSNARHIVRSERGFTLVAVLIVVTLVATVVGTYAHHLVVKGRSSFVSKEAIDAREQCRSALEYAHHTVLTGQPCAASLDSGSGSTSHIQLGDLPGNHKSLWVQTVTASGAGATRLVEAELVPTALSAPGGPDALPRLPLSSVNALVSDASIPRIHYSDDTVVAGADLYGILVLEGDTQLRLSDVVVHGCVVSQNVLSDYPFGAFDSDAAPSLVVDGSVRIDAADFLPGVAILMPDGEVSTGSADGRIQIRGDVVAHSVSLDRPGALSGNLLSVTPAQLDVGLEQMTSIRRPSDWASALELGGSWDTRFLAVVPDTPTLSEVGTITEYWSP